MKEFSQVYRNLKTLRNNLDAEEFDTSRLSPEALGMNLTRRNKLLNMLQDKGYVSGLDVVQFIVDSEPTVSKLENLEITMDDLQYLEENSMMRKVAKLVKGIKDVI